MNNKLIYCPNHKFTICYRKGVACWCHSMKLASVLVFCWLTQLMFSSSIYQMVGEFTEESRIFLLLSFREKNITARFFHDKRWAVLV